MASGKRIAANGVQILVIDVQDRLLPVVRRPGAIERQIVRLLDAAVLLEIPIVATEQYPKGLGPTTTSVNARLPNPPIRKMQFSAATSEVRNALDSDKAVVIVGIETHVCVAQTAADLVDAGFRVLLPRDAVSARFEIDHETALDRMARFGVTVTTCEALLFEWLESAEHTHFKAISRLVKEFVAEPE